MTALWAAVALLLAATCVAARQGAGPDPGGDWIKEPGARADVQAGVMVVRRGTVRTVRLYSDFAFRFEFRLLQPTAEGRVLLRSRFGYGTAASERGYRVGLTNRIDGVDALGRLSGADVGMKKMEYTPAQA
ncbi:MAG TPA: hypothetical protein VMS53_04410, partial [Burkholderiales bacterium]|nr:hypothetical protein [Burkholderiales bacterium]